MEQSFAADRPLAQHCAELVARGPRPEDCSEFLTAWRRDLGRALSQELSPLLAGARIDAGVGDAEWLTGQEVFERIGSVAANCLLRCGEAQSTVLLSIDFATAVALTDRSFGGDGAKPPEAPVQLPRSAALLVDQAARIIAQAIVDVSSDGTSAESTGDVIVRSESAARLKPFEPNTPCAALALELTTEGAEPWSMLLAMPADRLDAMLPGLDMSKPTFPTDARPPDAATASFGAIPLPIEAVLAEFELSLGRLETLAPGDEIPLAMPREVPLRTGTTMLAHGSVGTLENRMALRLTSISQGASGS